MNQEVISKAFEIGATLFDSIICVWFITSFNKDSKKKIWLWLSTILILFGSQFIFDTYFTDYNIIGTSIQFVISALFAIVISNRHYIKALVSACIYKALLITLSSSLFYLYLAIFTDFNALLMGTGSIPRYVYVLTHKVLMFASLKLILRLFERESVWKKLEGILTFGFSIFTVVGMALTLSIAQRIDAMPIRFTLLNIAIVMIVLNIILYILLSRLSTTYKKNYELQLQAQVSAFEDKRYQNALDEWNKAEKVRHDVKHQMIAISGMIEDGKVDECKAFLAEYISNLERNGKFTKSGNNIIDCLIDSKLSPLQNTQIIVSGIIDDLSDIKETDLASLIGNMLDNAVEAEENVTDKRIELHFYNKNDNRIIICRNNIERSVLTENRELKTSKKQKNGHGFGHQIIEDIAKKYNGFSDFFEDNGMFCVQIVLPKKQNNKTNIMNHSL